MIITYPDKRPFIEAIRGVRERISRRVWGDAVYREIVALGRGEATLLRTE